MSQSRSEILTTLYKDKSLKTASYRIAPNKYIAEDLFQEVFIRLFEMSDEQFNRIVNPKYFIIKMMLNMCRGNDSFFNNFIKIYPNVNLETESQSGVDVTEEEVALCDKYFSAVTPVTISVVRELSKIEKESLEVSRYPYKKDLFVWYCKLGSSRKVQDEVGVNRMAVQRIVNEIKKRVNENSNSQPK